MISVKKLATVGVAAGLLMGSAVPVLADDDMVVRQKNIDTDVTNNVEVKAKTGNNDIGGGSGGGRKIRTGNADAYSLVSNYVNKNKVRVTDCDCFDDLTVKQKNIDTDVTNDVEVKAKTGNNHIGGGSGGGRRIRTGDAYADSAVFNLVNKNLVKVGP